LPDLSGGFKKILQRNVLKSPLTIILSPGGEEG